MISVLLALSPLSGFALVFLLAIISTIRWFRAPSDRRRTELFLIAAVLVEPLCMAGQLIAQTLSSLRPFKYDLFIFQFDALFGQPSFQLGQLVFAHLWLRELVSASYGLLPAAMLLVFLAYLYLASESEAKRVAGTFVLLFAGGVFIYLLIPVSGPVYAFPSFPALPASSTAAPIALPAAPPNGVPSGHTGAAFLVLWFLWRWNWGKAAGLTFVGLTVLATLGSGQHYLFDLLCALPYTALVLHICWHSHWKEQHRERRSQPVLAVARKVIADPGQHTFHLRRG